MLSLDYYALSLLILTILTGVSCENLTPTNEEVFSVEGSTVTLSYKLSREVKTNDYFYWYQQYAGIQPELMISHSASGLIGTEKISGLKIEVGKNQFNMSISSAAVTDSAVYYCALQPTVTGNTKPLYKNLWSKDNRILHNIH
ncbi:unnamed protein product [Oreochromis niloticus]|nr:unnamed protein product [Mustela putorius furo]